MSNDHVSSARPFQQCQRTRLVTSSVAAVDQCSCGTMHLHIGAMTLHLQPEAYRQLVQTLTEGLTQLTLRKLMDKQGILPISAQGGGQA